MTSLLLAMSGVAFAQSTWEDGLTTRAPVTFGASLHTAAVLDRDQAVFGDLRVGGPIVSAAKGAFILGVLAQGQTVSLFTADGRNPSRIRNLGPDLWLSFVGPQRRSVHSVVFRYRQPLSEGTSTSWYQQSPVEVGYRAAILYDGYLDTGPVIVSLETSFGLNDVTIAELGATLALLAPIGSRAVAGLGVKVGYPTLQTVLATARLRPLEELEIGLYAALPVQLGGEVGRPYPGLELTLQPRSPSRPAPQGGATALMGR